MSLQGGLAMGCRIQSAISNVQNNHLCTFAAEGTPQSCPSLASD